jgi:oligopeptide transport system substrate-binding protein
VASEEDSVKPFTLPKPARLLAACVLLTVGTTPVMAGHTGAAPASTWQTEPVTFYGFNLYPLLSLDPQLASDNPSIGAVENLFLGLTDLHPVTNEAVPELATSWTISEDGLLWTFFLRDDVPWVRWNPVTQEAEILRMVTAYDVAYGIQRLCDPRLEAGYIGTAVSIISGCHALANMPLNEITEADYDRVQVRALDDTTLEIRLRFAAGYFLSMSTMWIFRPVPREIIEEHGAAWTEVGTLVTNGPFMLDERIDGVRRVFVRNPYLPADLRGPGNVERVIITEIEDFSSGLALYRDHQLDSAVVPPAEVPAMLADPAYADQLVPFYDYTVPYFGFTYDKPPFDNVHARRAFAAIVDRQRFIEEEVSLAFAAPMIHFTPPGMFGAPPIDQVGVGYNPDYAREQLALAGYPDCQGFPPITILVAGDDPAWGEFLAESAEAVLGCPPDRFHTEAMPFPGFFDTIDITLPPEKRPEVWTLLWAPDYPDASNWVGDVLSCEMQPPTKRPCTEVDDLITQAAAESDPAARAALYYDIEERFFGPEGEHPIIPLYLGGGYALFKPWLSGPLATDGFFGGTHYDWRTIDRAAQLAARGE